MCCRVCCTCVLHFVPVRVTGCVAGWHRLCVAGVAECVAVCVAVFVTVCVACVL